MQVVEQTEKNEGSVKH